MGWDKQLKLILSFFAVMLFLPIIAGAAVMDGRTLIPMGQSIGIKMDLSGVFITNDVLLDEDVWLKTGDLIEKLNKVPISTIENFESELLAIKDKGEVEIGVLRNTEPLQVQSDSEAVKKLIPFLKDSTEGTGTLTYVDPENNTYGALGHQIIDSSLNSAPSFTKGSIQLSEIEQIRKSLPGNPGYKISSIVKDEHILGTIRENGIYGIFGTWNDTYSKVLAEPLEIMQPENLKIGEAEIFTTVKGTKVESFSIKITKVEKDQFYFILTDAGLMETTGGILQGMSGSPVIQNGKFAGVVTHMFVDEPEKGAALFLSTMRSAEK